MGRKYTVMEDGPWETALTNSSPEPRILKARVHDYRAQITWCQINYTSGQINPQGRMTTGKTHA